MAMNRIQIISLVSEATGKDLKTAGYIIDTFLETIKTTLVGGGKVVLDNFGAFEIVDCKERKFRNSRTSEEFIAPAYKKPSFSAARSFRELANKKD